MVYTQESGGPVLKTAKIFANGRSQAVRLPAEFRFEGNEVYIRRDEANGDVILSQKKANWDAFFEALRQVDDAEGFLGEDERRQSQTDRDPFEGWSE
jgi:antitoxin VapB